jgi:predicted nuclease of predicted toxin-antitoxin system
MAGLLIDNNLSVLIKKIFENEFPNSQHVYDLGLEAANDNEIWELARKSFDAIISKDRDFYYKVILNGSPPKLILITKGNCSNKEIFSLIRKNLKLIKNFL